MYRLSLKIEGDISIESFRDALASFIQLLHEVDESVSGGRSVRWRLVDLRHGSPAVLTWAGEPRRAARKKTDVKDLAPVIADRIISGMEQLEQGKGRPLDFTDDALDATKRLAHLRTRRGITGLAIRGENADRQKPSRTLDVTERVAATVNEIIGPKYTAAGSVEGTLQAINSHGMLFFNIYDSIWGGRVRCDIPDVLKARALELFDQRVLVSGIVSTDAAGHPRHVKAERIDELPKRGQLVQSLKGIDPDYTSGLDSGEYLKKRWGGDA